MHIDCELSDATIAAFEAWLALHARQVKILKAKARSYARLQLQLPWAKLLQLETLSLTNFTVPPISSINTSTTAGGSGDPGSGSNSGAGPAHNAPLPTSALLPRLMQIHLIDCTLDSLDSLLQLGSSSCLTSLVVMDCEFHTHADMQHFSTAVSALVTQHPQLVVLQLPEMALNLAAVKCVVGLRSLEDLHITVGADGQLDSASFSNLASSLTGLQLEDSRERGLKIEHPTLPPQLHQLSSLQWLQLFDCSLLPAVLGSMTKLVHLRMRQAILSPAVVVGHGNSAAGVSALLSALQNLTQLQHLELEQTVLDTAGVLPQQFSALTASTQLTFLSLFEDSDRPLAQGSGQHVFAAGRRLPHLRTLKFDTSSLDTRHAWCLDGPDLHSLTECCPSLEALDLYCVVRNGADLSALLQLPDSCVSLGVGGGAFDDAAAGVVAQMTQLTQLTFMEAPSLTDTGVQQLTALKGLRKLRVLDCEGPDGVLKAAGCTDYDLELHWTEAKVGAAAV